MSNISSKSYPFIAVNPDPNSIDSREIFTNDAKVQEYKYHRKRLLHYEKYSTIDLVISLRYTMLCIPLTEIIWELRTVLKSQRLRGYLIRISTTCALTGRAGVKEVYQSDPTAMSIINLSEFKTPFGFSQTPFALIGHIIIAAGRVLPNIKERAQAYFGGGAGNIWEVSKVAKRGVGYGGSSTTLDQTYLRELRAVNLHYVGRFAEKLHQTGPFDDYDIQTLQELAVKLECS